ncbi:coiled-coil domain-containing protein [Prochlorothrix hollandica]|uniref:Uncharacterized protein n=1 Tax=Prochlorothrix hollandica PCC 9006 = CALU 1027 TaxID=317619 RepID=A0A0M2PNN1_PROHO|nr:hypothetical protein [Prochlorothrix hollandica]KKI98225.1 hypothetical protein PROH_21385 [Prochlorothrix hollandica PCC 9006 = CALU 1027]
MSGTPKYSPAELERQRQQQLEEERRRKAAEEARLRAEAAERERRQRLENLRNRVNSQQQSVASKIQQQQSSMYPQDVTALQQRCQNQINTICQAQDESRLQNVATELNQILQDCDKAVTRKRRDDEEKKRKAEIERLQFELEELERGVGRIPASDASKFDATGQSSVQEALGAVRSALASGSPQTVQAPINHASTVVKQHTQAVSQRRAEWEKRKAEAEQIVGQIQDLVTGLKADPIVMLWHSHTMAQLENQLKQAQQAIASEQFDQPSQILAKIQAQEKQIIEEANIAQLKADKRDYITQSIVATLQDMGFAVLSIEDEHKGHPSTAKVFTATAAGRAISVNVPVEGQVWYDVDGYSKNTVSSIADGSPVAICDEAEAVLTEMHTALQQEFGIQMGEISWQGKDPNRITRTATDLSTDAKQSRGGS